VMTRSRGAWRNRAFLRLKLLRDGYIAKLKG
jgi:hypothetical protein